MDEDQKQIVSDLARINELLLKIPSTYGDWYYQRVIDFKNAAIEASNVKPTSSPERVRQARMDLEHFYL